MDVLFTSGVLAFGLAMGVPGVASAATTAACSSSTSHSHSVTSRGTVSDSWTTTQRCGKAYQTWRHGWMRSYTGASNSWHSYKDGRQCPDRHRWSMTKWLHSISKTGTTRNTVTSSSGSC